MLGLNGGIGGRRWCRAALRAECLKKEQEQELHEQGRAESGEPAE